MLIYFKNKKQVLGVIGQYFHIWCKIIKTQGLEHAVKYFKQVRLHVTRYMCGEALLTNTMSIGLDKSGFPKCVLFLKKYIDSESLMDKRFALTLLNLGKTITFDKLYVFNKNLKKYVKKMSMTDGIPLDTISNPSYVKKQYIIPSNIIKEFVSVFNLNAKLPTWDEKNIFLSTKGGPQGKSTLNILRSALCLSYHQMHYISRLTSLPGFDWFCGVYKKAWELDLFPKEKIFTGKLSTIMDSECKVRVIAMLDGISQLFLRPVHDDLMNLIRRLPCDRTYTQDPYHSWDLTNSHKFWSMDLSAATDRFPLHLQKRLIHFIFKDDIDGSFAESWGNLLTDRNFWVPQSKLDRGIPGSSTVRYSVGQPMGAYSSWVAFSLSHHLVVHYCALQAGFKLGQFDQYIILGDDIVLKNDDVAKWYIKVMTKLGVELSINKTHVSQNTYEFAKRWIIVGKGEVTPIPIKGIVNNIQDPSKVLVILYDYIHNKCCYLPIKSNSCEFVLSFYKKLKVFMILKKDPKEVKPSSKSLDLVKSKNKFSLVSLYGRKMKTDLRNFFLSIRISFDHATYDELRSLISYKTRNNDIIMVPNSQVAQSNFLQWILKLGIGGMVQVHNNRIMSLVNTFTDPKTLDSLGIKDWRDLSYVPLFQACLNNINSKLEISKLFDGNDISAKETIKGLIQLDIKSAINNERDKILPVITFGKTLNRAFYKINEIDEIYYGSSLGLSSIESPFSVTLEMNLSTLIRGLLSLKNKTWVDPMANPWAAYL